MISELNRRPMLGNNENSFGDDLEKEIGLLLREQRRQDADDREKELNIYRSGSAPPTVEGSLSAVSGLFNNHGGAAGGGGGGGGLPFSEFGQNGNGFMSEEELRSDPAYYSYYYSNVNLNPRLPPPLISKEDYRFAQRLQGGSSAIGDKRKGSRNESGRSLFSMPPGFNAKKLETENDPEVPTSVEWGGDGLIGLPGFGLGNKQKSFADIFQDDISRPTPVIGPPSRPTSRNAFDDNVDSFGASAEAELAHLRSTDPSFSSTNAQKSSYSYAAALGTSLSRSTTPDPQHIARAPSPCLTPIGGGRNTNSDKRSVNSPSLFNEPNKSTDLVTALSGLNLTNGSRDEQATKDHNNYLFNIPSGEVNTTNQNPYLRKSDCAHFNMVTAPQEKLYRKSFILRL